MNHVEFAVLTVATSTGLQEDESLTFKGKCMVALLPPFLAKALMDADTEDAVTLMMVMCKTLCQFNIMADGGFVPNGTKSEEGEANTNDKFLHVVQFLFLVGRDTQKGAPINILTMAWAEVWATSVAMDCSIRMAPPQETMGASNSEDDSSNVRTPTKRRPWQETSRIDPRGWC